MTIGRLNFSIKGIVLAIVIIFITQLAVRVGRELLKEKILDKQSLERGLQDSILTITSYLGWGLGLILALGTLGVNATSLAVIFGALSIGIGFGLQNIFNNFISGLILLFERPIQVGDYVEVGGLWAEVKKINVRATVVQTFDNASVIIPNSEFISQQVTNWSFKDKRMRRQLDIGVAYGSDIELVQKTLLDLAQNTRGVLKYPRPDVLFIDHADSALIFRLRIWVHVDDFWTVPSQIRCDIDRRFRELAIEIAFPQRDLHIRTLPGQMAPIASPADSTSVQPKFEGES
jgi:small-conductance mechanosensitive channel